VIERPQCAFHARIPLLGRARRVVDPAVGLRQAEGVRIIETADAPSRTGPVPRAVEADGYGRTGENARFTVGVVAYRG
jgi:hypothetical protein